MKFDDVMKAVKQCTCPFTLKIPNDAVILPHLFHENDMVTSDSIIRERNSVLEHQYRVWSKKEIERYFYKTYDEEWFPFIQFKVNQPHPLTNTDLSAGERVLEEAQNFVTVIMLAANQAINDNAATMKDADVWNFVGKAFVEERRYGDYSILRMTPEERSLIPALEDRVSSTKPNNQHQQIFDYLNSRTNEELDIAKRMLNAFIENPNPMIAVAGVTQHDVNRAEYMRRLNVHKVSRVTVNLKSGHVVVEGASKQVGKDETKKIESEKTGSKVEKQNAIDRPPTLVYNFSKLQIDAPNNPSGSLERHKRPAS